MDNKKRPHARSQLGSIAFTTHYYCLQMLHIWQKLEEYHPKYNSSN